jgi:putative transcriptional regulator
MASTAPATPIRCRIDDLLAERQMTLTELSKRVGVTFANLSVLKNNRARAVRFTTLAALCEVLECTVGDIFEYADENPQRCSS